MVTKYFNGMNLEDANEIKRKTDELFVGFNQLLMDYERVLNDEEFQTVKLNIGNILASMYFDCLKVHVYSKFPDLEPI